MAEGESARITGRAAHPALRRCVRGYWGYRYDLGRPLWRREPPGGVLTVIINLGPAFEVGWVKRGTHPVHTAAPMSAFIAGVHDEAAFTADSGTQRGVELNLTPLGVPALFGLPTRAFTGQVVALEDAFGPGAGGLVERLAAAPSWERRFAILDSALLARLGTGRDPRAPHPMVAEAWDILHGTAGRATVAQLCAATGHSRRHLTARFHELAGLPPKAMARILRFRAALDLIDAPEPPPLADIALRCGYYDQAHLNRDVAALAGCTPTVLRAERVRDIAGAVG
ncbi:AraC-like DNA-binding protein [Murinocardiopsis flavida]|uniref:AraC-like DNA-binding protein n=1 Tax=Murinocardiopsis flavida TaxID=645275 RepID=A0A2P8DSI3_9ACTN|nr:helix-turn-helix domain-containing protein [Murinocardiopsis flavida]PSL00168.1 AraC-like DNA-binding protein [Murinocardiopsis flavida]